MASDIQMKCSGDLMCLICNDQLDNQNNGVYCQNNDCMCNQCFLNQVTSQISELSIGSFANNGCKIICSYCKIPFSDKQIAANVPEEIYDKFIKAKLEVSSNKAVLEYEKVIEIKRQQSKILSYRNHICENILTLHCAKCKAAVFDFDGCFAVECGTCKGSMCGWCLGDFSPDAHSHVKRCKYSLSPGGLYGTTEQFKSCHKTRRENEIRKYLDTICDTNEKTQLIELIKQDLEDLGINIGVLPSQIQQPGEKNELPQQLLEQLIVPLFRPNQRPSRLQKDFNAFLKHIRSNNDIFTTVESTYEEALNGSLSRGWNDFNVLLKGPVDTPYFGAKFLLNIKCTEIYPFEPPKIKFITKIFHPNINYEGSIWLNILSSQWTPVMDIVNTLFIITALISSPNYDDPLNEEAGILYRRSKLEFEMKVREYVQKYAIMN